MSLLRIKSQFPDVLNPGQFCVQRLSHMFGLTYPVLTESLAMLVG
jgi:hypothetical protein